MKLLEKTTQIKDTLSLPFTVGTAGWHALSVSARVKGEKQRYVGATDDEDLTLELDGEKLPKAANFSGGDQQGNTKTVFVICHLSPGNHTLYLRPDEGALIESAELQNLSTFPLVQFTLNQTAERANGRPWVAFVILGADLTSFTVKGKVAWRFWDGDDLKVVVDGKVKQNPLSILHRNWIFAAGILRRIFDRETFEETFSDTLPYQKYHSVELWADESPTLYFVSFVLREEELTGNIPEPATGLKPYKSDVSGRDYNRFDTAIVKEVGFWNSYFMLGRYPPPQPLDPNLVKAMVCIESVMGYGAFTSYSAYPDVMQVADPANPAIHTLNNDGWIDPITGRAAREYEWIEKGVVVLDYEGKANGRTPDQSIHWGVRWLYHKAQRILEDGTRGWVSWEEAVAAYNGGGDPSYQKKVYRIYEDGIAPNYKRLWSLVVMLFSVLSLIGISWLYSRQGVFYVGRGVIAETRDFQFYISVLDGLRVRRLSFSTFYRDGSDSSAFYNKDARVEPLYSPSPTTKTIAVYGKDFINYEVVSVLSYKDGQFTILPNVSEKRGLQNTFNAGSVFVANYDSDPEEEVVERTLIRYDGAPDQVWQDYYDWDAKRGVYTLTESKRIPI